MGSFRIDWRTPAATALLAVVMLVSSVPGVGGSGDFVIMTLSALIALFSVIGAARMYRDRR